MMIARKARLWTNKLYSSKRRWQFGGAEDHIPHLEWQQRNAV